MEAETRVGHLRARKCQIAGNNQKLGEARKGSSLASSEGTWVWRHLECRVLAFRMMREYRCHLTSPDLWYLFQ